MPLLYDLATGAYHAGIQLAAPFNGKAMRWVEGRKGLWERTDPKRAELAGCIWMQASSVGEFEQGRPVLEALHRKHPNVPILLTFFSPSGYEARKDLDWATHVEYLPADNARNAARWLDLVRPRMVIFVKYDFWYHHLSTLHEKRIPTFLISARFRTEQPFFKAWGSTHRRMLKCFTHIFVQDEASHHLLNGIGVKNATVSGDTRFDRVVEIAQLAEDLPLAKAFKGNDRVFVCGSTWPEDERSIAEALKVFPDLKVIIAPHEFKDAEMMNVELAFPQPVVRWSEARIDEVHKAKTLLVDRMGLLSRLYRYGDVTYVGGGFNSGIHNILEAAVWGVPVVFGPKHRKFVEAQALIDAGGAFSVQDKHALQEVLKKILEHPETLAGMVAATKQFVLGRTGATDHILKGLDLELR